MIGQNMSVLKRNMKIIELSTQIFLKFIKNNFMGNLLEDYYKAMNSGDEWRYVNADEIREKIEEEKEAASWNGREPNYDYGYNEMGS